MNHFISTFQYLSKNDMKSPQTFLEKLQNQDVAVYENGALRVVGKIDRVGHDPAIQAAIMHLTVDADTKLRFENHELEGLHVDGLTTYVLIPKRAPLKPVVASFSTMQCVLIGLLGMGLGMLMPQCRGK